MNPNLYRSFIGLSIAVVLVACAARAHAAVSRDAVAASTASSTAIGASAAASVSAGSAQAQLGEVIRCLKQATLQWDFASNAEVLALLRQAHDHLMAAARRLDGPQRIQADELLTNLNDAIARASTQLGTLAAPTAGAYGSVALDRGQLAVLAAEGQDLQQGRPFAHRALVADTRARWPQAHFEF